MGRVLTESPRTAIGPKPIISVVILGSIITLMLVSLLANGYNFGIGGQNIDVVLLKRTIDSSFLKRDWYVNSNNGLNARSFYNWAMASLSVAMGLDGAHLIVYLAGLFVLCLTTYLIAVAIWQDPQTGLLAVPIILYSRSGSLSRSQLARSELYPSSLAYSLLTLAAYLLYKKRFTASFVLFGLIGLLHPLAGPEAALIFGAAAFVSFSCPEQISMLKRLPLLAAAIIVPLGLGVLSKQGSQAAVDQSEIMYIVAWQLAPMHYLPSSWGSEAWLIFGGFALLVGIARARGAGARFLDAVIFFIGAFCILGSIGFIIEPLLGTIIAQPFRMTVFFQWAAALYLAHYAMQRLRDQSLLSRSGGVVLLGGLVLAARLPGRFIIWLALAMLLFEATRHVAHRFERLSSMRLLAVVSLAGITLYAAVCLVNLLPRLGPIQASLIALGSLGVAWLGGWTTYTGRYTRPFLVACSLASLCLLGALGVAWEGMRLPHILARLNSPLRPHIEYTGDFDQIAYWARTNTAPDAVFIVPPESVTFRLKAERAIVINFLAMPFKDDSIHEWRNRLYDFAGGRRLPLGYTAQAQLAEAYRQLSRAQLISLASRYDADYLVVGAGQHLGLPIAYRTTTYVVYKVSE